MLRPRIILLVLGLWSSTTLAQASMRVKFDCYLVESGANCQELGKQFASLLPIFELVGDERQAELVIKIRTMPIQDGLEYQFEFITTGDERRVTTLPPDKVPSSLSPELLMDRLLVSLQKGAFLFLKQKAPARMSDGQVEVIFEAADDQSETRPSDNSTRWYYSANVSGNYSKNQNEELYVNAGATVNYASPRWRLYVGGSSGFTRRVVNDPDNGEMIGRVFWWGSEAMVVYTVAGGWSVAAILDGGHVPQDNVDRAGSLSFGMEWTLSPFLEGRERNVSVRYKVGAVHDEYEAPNINNRTIETYMKHVAEVYLFWHFNRLDLSMTTGASSIIGHWEYSRIYGDGSLSWRITDNISLSPNYSVGYRHKLLNAPLEQTDSNPIQQQVSGGAFSNWRLYGGLNFSVVWGNSRLKNNDQRWK